MRGAHTAVPQATAKPSNRRVHADRIGTEPMTRHQREHAVMALAALIAAWQHGDDPSPRTPGEDSATPLPLPRTPSEADHAA